MSVWELLRIRLVIHESSKREDMAFKFELSQCLRFGFLRVTPRGRKEEQTGGKVGLGIGPKSTNWEVALEQVAFGSHGDSLNVSLCERIMDWAICGTGLADPSELIACFHDFACIITMASNDISRCSATCKVY